MLKTIKELREFKNGYKCPFGHDHTSNCRRNGCPCDNHTHKEAIIAYILWKINRKIAFWYCLKYEIPF